MANITNTGIDFVFNPISVPFSLISQELEGLYGSELLAEFNEIIGYYNVYEKGANFIPESVKSDFTSADLRFKESRKLINREARFLFSKHPDMKVNVPYEEIDPEEYETEEELEEAYTEAKEDAIEVQTVLQKYLDNVLEKSDFFLKLVKAARDCFIGKRVAYFVNFDEEKHKIMIDFVPSLEFVFDTDPSDINKVTKIVAFYTIKDNKAKTEQRIYKKKYWLEDDEKETCWMQEAIYNGLGEMVEEITPERATKFEGYIPAGVVINEGLTGDLKGVSEIHELVDSESWFSRISNGDIDSERCGMNPIRYAINMNPETTKGLSISPGAFWDLAQDPNAPDSASGSVGMLETGLNYTSAVNTTLNRIRASMFESLDIPDVSSDAMRGVVSSGKTLRAIYWSLIVRCDEKMLSWRPALKNIIRIIIEGGKLYPDSTDPYTEYEIPDSEYDITVDNQYPIPDDEAEEKNVDLSEVSAQTMSRMSYMKKWRGLTETEAMQELRQIAEEREILESMYGAEGMVEDEEMSEEDMEETGNMEGEEDMEDLGLDTADDLEDDSAADDEGEWNESDELPEDEYDDSEDDAADPDDDRLMKMLDDLEKELEGK